MKLLLKKQLKQLENIDKSLQTLVTNSKQDKFIQVGQLLEEKALDKHENEVAHNIEGVDGELEKQTVVLTEISKSIQSQNNGVVS